MKLLSVVLALALVAVSGFGMIPAEAQSKQIEGLIDIPVSIIESVNSACRQLCNVLPINVGDMDKFLDTLIDYRSIHIRAGFNAALMANVLLFLASLLVPILGPILFVLLYPVLGLQVSGGIFIIGILLSAYRMSSRRYFI